jgi:sulfite reductase beta subunit-like hemoprotein
MYYPLVKKKALSTMKNLKDIMKIVGCDMDRARRILDEMACTGLDFSECSNAAFKKAALSAANYIK